MKKNRWAAKLDPFFCGYGAGKAAREKKIVMGAFEVVAFSKWCTAVLWGKPGIVSR
jgi:hypothetical protein